MVFDKTIRMEIINRTKNNVRHIKPIKISNLIDLKYFQIGELLFGEREVYDTGGFSNKIFVI